MIPGLFQHYTYSVVESDRTLTVNTSSGVSKLDQEQLKSLGWKKISNTAFTYKKPKVTKNEVDTGRNKTTE